MGSSTVLRGAHYEGLDRPWGSSALAEQNAGGGLLCGLGDLIGLLLVVVLLRQWMRPDVVVAAREDRRVEANRPN